MFNELCLVLIFIIIMVILSVIIFQSTGEYEINSYFGGDYNEDISKNTSIGIVEARPAKIFDWKNNGDNNKMKFNDNIDKQPEHDTKKTATTQYKTNTPIIAAMYKTTKTFHSNNINWDRVEIIQNLGSGAYGDVYIAKYDSDSSTPGIYALKREKISPKNVIVSKKTGSLKLKPSRELKFYNFIDTLPPNEQKYFVRLQAHRAILCTHSHKWPSYLQKMLEGNSKLQKRLANLEKSPYCAEYLMDFGGNSLKSITDKMTKNNNVDFQFMKKVTLGILNIIKITRKNNYIIDDLHSGNITVLDNKTRDSDIGVKLIDYNEVKDVNIDKYMQGNFDTNRDLLSLIGLLLNGGYFFINYLSKIDKFPPITEHIRFIRKVPGAWEKMVGYITTIDKRKQISDTIGKIDRISDIKNKSLVKEIDQRLGPYIGIIFAILYPKEDIAWWNIVATASKIEIQDSPDSPEIQDSPEIPEIPLLLPQSDLVFMLDNYNNMDKLISHFEN